MIIRKTPKYKKENSWDIEYVKFIWKIFKTLFFFIFTLSRKLN